MEIGYIGLGKMGLGMVERLVEKGHVLHTYAPSQESRDKAMAVGAHSVDTLQALVDALPVPRTVWLMVPHAAVEGVLQELLPLLSAGDTVIDGGNSPYKDSVRRAEEVRKLGLHFMDVGVSGGPSGARHGACLMIGGQQDDFTKYESLFNDIAIEKGYAYVGEAGAGHFVKMVHNGIEYGMMQAIGEGFEVLKKSSFQLDMLEVSRIYNTQSVITSRLTDWLYKAYQQSGVELEGISGSIAQSGEGMWTVDAAHELNVPTPIIEGSVAFRTQSQNNPSYTGKVVSALRNQFGGHVVKE